MQARIKLPENYTELFSVDMARNWGLAIALNIIAAAIFIGLWFNLSSMVIRIRPDIANLDPSTVAESNLLLSLAGLIGMLFLHEGIHGLFFWTSTRSIPMFGFSLLYAFAAAPNWFIPRNQYLWIGLSPLVIISGGLFLGLWFAPPQWLGLMVFICAINAGGSVGDMYVVLRLLQHNADTLINDRGNAMTAYGTQS